MEGLFQKFRAQFIDEISGLLEQMEADLLALEKQPDNRLLIDQVFRAVHTIKGTCGMYGFVHISELAHHLENIFQTIRDTNTSFHKDIIDISLAARDHIRNLMEDEKLTDTDNIQQHEILLEKITDYQTSSQTFVVADVNASASLPSSVEGNNDTKTWSILVRTDEQIFFRGISLVNILNDLASLGTYHIHSITALNDAKTETWGIVLISQASLNDIKEVFMFIEDNCTFTLIQEGDILNPETKLESIQPEEIELSVVDERQVPDILPKLEPKPLKISKEIERPQDPIRSSDEKQKVLKTSLLLGNVTKNNLKRIAVDSVKLDYLMYLVSELITLNSQLLQTTKDDYYEQIRPQIEQMESLTKLFRANALEIRLVPLGDLVVKFQRLVRDLSGQLGKKVDFVTHGTDTELDKNTIDQIAEPIIHIIRNCLDHGIENPEERLSKGKPETGTVKFSATHIGNYIHLKIEDDGAGLDLEKIREKAVKRGLIKKSDTLTKQELTNLIFHSGLSTAQSITEVSGRGVGMDVVKRKITELRGEILVDTEPGKGTSFILKIQQSIAIIDTLLFRVENSYFILPLTEIEVCIRIDKEELITRQNTATIQYNNQAIPYLNLRAIFNLHGHYPNKVKALILHEGNQYMAFLCDEILGEQQAVLKPLGQAFKNDTGLLAVTQHGNGKWAYMLNTHFLHEKLKQGNLQTAPLS
jgi:two-component system, chemotaxis family, sensor kinase CheA